MYDKILVALDDGSEQARWLATATIALAGRTGAEVVALHVNGGGREADAAELTWDIVAQLTAAGVRAQARLVRPGGKHVAAIIANAADHYDADLIVTGPRGLCELRGVLSGSVGRGASRGPSVRCW